MRPWSGPLEHCRNVDPRPMGHLARPMGRISMLTANGIFVGAVLVLPFALGCRPLTNGTEAEELGTFVVNGALVENGCAGGLSPIDPLQFRVTLSRSHNSLTWRMPDGAPTFGVIRERGEFRIQSSIPVEAWAPDLDNGIVGCSLSQVETIEGRLELPEMKRDGAAPSNDAGVDARARFEGSHRIEVVPMAGSDCSALLIIQGGEFPSLPCAARYELDGEAE